ncbi:MAG: penicillin-binding protein 2 [Coxiellaceae bacterium]|nr:penicillin-binding protein 2 [Coxiellaceae bacterium]
MVKQAGKYRWRFYLVYALFALLVAALLFRLIELGVFQRHFLLKQSQARVLRNVVMPAHRGMIRDRNGKPLAISTSVVSIWVNPQQFDPTPVQLKQLATILQLPQKFITRRGKKRGEVEFAYLRRRVSPDIALRVKQLAIAGLHEQKEYKRFYPESSVTSHVVGFTNIDDQGQEGIELAYNQWLAGSPGLKKVLKDRLGHVIANVSQVKSPVQGKDLTLSVDQRLQFLAYDVLAQTVEKYKAKAGSIVIMDPKTGEVLAMVNQPTYNPNNRPVDTDGRYRNRAITDIFEPGSTIKPFNVAYALESGKYTADSTIDTSPGWMRIGGYTIRDDGLNLGVINLTDLLRKSSNIGAAKLMLSLPPVGYWRLLREMGFGERTRSGFPGEASGTLVDRDVWRPSVVAGMAYGYGMAVTALQLAQAYSIIADSGIKMPVSLLRRQQPVQGQQVMPPEVANTITGMLQQVVEGGGTGRRAKIRGYHIAGKTGTAYIAGPQGYNKKKYVSSFVGFAPVSNPQLVVAIIIFEPQGQHFGAKVAAPAFARVMSGALRLLNIAPDNLKG